MIWSVPELTPSASPRLNSDEKVVLSVDNVGIYDGDIKSVNQSKGSAIITSQRLIYIDILNPILNSVQVFLEQIEQLAYTPRLFTSSAKVKLTLSSRQQKSDKTESARKGWICSICSFSNPLQATKCEVCGVAIQEDTVYVEPSSGPSNASEKRLGECQQCTFLNHPSLNFCELCGSPLKHEVVQSCTLGNEVKLSFRGGKSHIFHETLQKVCDELKVSTAKSLVTIASGTTKSTEPTDKPTDLKASFGIHSLQAQNRKLNNESQVILDDALKSANNFKLRLPELVAIADKLSLVSTARKQLPIVVGAESRNAAALSKQIADLFIGNDELLSQAGGMLTLQEAYSTYNRCRALGLVSPQEFLEALDQCEPLDLPLRVRTLESGLKIVESRGGLDQALQRLLHWIKLESRPGSWRENSGFSARDVSEKFGCSVQVALEELILAELRGTLCRDEHMSGLHFFPNLILQSSHSS